MHHRIKVEKGVKSLPESYKMLLNVNWTEK